MPDVHAGGLGEHILAGNERMELLGDDLLGQSAGLEVAELQHARCLILGDIGSDVGDDAAGRISNRHVSDEIGLRLLRDA